MYKFIFIFSLLMAHFIIYTSCQYDEFEENSENAEDNSESSEQTTVATTTTTTPKANVSTPSPAHVVNQVNKVVSNVETLNISGIVDQALAIRNDGPVRQLVNGIIQAVFCNPFFAGVNNCGSGNRLKDGSNIPEPRIGENVN